MTREEAKSCIGTIEMLQRLAYNIHGVMDVVDADNCKNIIKALEKEPCEDCISRQEVLDKIYNIDGMEALENSNIFAKHYADMVKSLPPVTPKQNPCEDAISRADVKKYLSAPDANGDRVIYESDLDLLPSVTPKEKTGHWVKTPKAVMGEGYMWYCDKCEHQVYQDSSRNYPSEKYCPNCGAKMQEVKE